MKGTKLRARGSKSSFGSLALGLGVFGVASLALAAPGDLIRTVTMPVPGYGVSVAVDCEGSIYYTFNSNTNLYKMDSDGALLDVVPLIDTATGRAVDIDEMSFDPSRNLLWGVEHGSNPIAVWQVDVSGEATLAFASSTFNIGTFADGIGYDASDDTLWVSGDISSTIEHYSAAPPYSLIPPVLTPRTSGGGVLGSISGVQVGIGNLLYLGRNGLASIVQVEKTTGDFISAFASPGGTRDEGLECDSVNFAPLLAVWSRDADLDFMAVIEIEPGTCRCTLCGDGTLDSGEACDDGNDETGDGCRPDCTVELCGDGITDPGEECDDGNDEPGDGCRVDCTVEICGDGIPDPGEECDDGNDEPGDGCRGDCTVEICGDGIPDPGEECDDGNDEPGDGCRGDCTVEICGDGIPDPGEECDDGNDEPGDGCRVDCTVEMCGDGLPDPGEDCDDGNDEPGDGCRVDCSAEECGDGILDPDEDCDDGNDEPGDGCEPDCTPTPILDVSYASYSAARDAAGVNVSWATTSEVGTIGFEVWSRNKDGVSAKLSTIVYSTGSGSSYALTDASAEAQSGETVAYRVVELTASGPGDATPWFAVAEPERGSRTRQRGGHRPR